MLIYRGVQTPLQKKNKKNHLKICFLGVKIPNFANVISNQLTNKQKQLWQQQRRI